MYQQNQKTDKNTQKRSRLLYISIVFFAFIFGWAFGHLDFQRQQLGYIPGIANNNENSANFKIFWDAWDKITQSYDGEIDYQKLILGAINGMVDALEDPYTVFLDEGESNRFGEDLEGSISGIGAEIGIQDDRVIIIAPISESPAEKAGLKAKDIILKINDDDTKGMNLNDAVGKIRGEAGTTVILQIERGSEKKEYRVTREKIEIKSVKAEVLENNIGYIEISKFDNNTGSLLREEGAKLSAKKVQGLIIDLRNNPGGYLDQAIEVTSEYLKEGIAVIEKREKDNKTKEYKVSGKGGFTDNNLPIVILINGGSASAAEIVAGALDDYERALLIGEKTFGKGSVQSIETLSGGNTLHITVAHWYTPKGRSIDGEGLNPDIVVTPSEEDLSKGNDPQLIKALEYLKEKIK